MSEDDTLGGCIAEDPTITGEDRLFAFFHENDWAGELNSVGNILGKSCNGYVLNLKTQVLRLVDLNEGEHDPSEVLEVMGDSNKEQMVREEDQRSYRRGRVKPVHERG